MSNKKEILDAFVGSITKPTAAPAAAPVTPSSTPAATVEASQHKHQAPGTNQAQGYTVRQTFVMDSVHLDKLRYIAFKEHTKQKDVLSQALDAFIKQWERKNGTITL